MVGWVYHAPPAQRRVQVSYGANPSRNPRNRGTRLNNSDIYHRKRIGTGTAGGGYCGSCSIQWKHRRQQVKESSRQADCFCNIGIFERYIPSVGSFKGRNEGRLKYV